ncbi:MAG TPA: tetratricopeptide repeat protein [Candidatus Angelobacter sp.]
MNGKAKPENAADPSELRAADMLDGWKAIADYLGKTERTVQRWEKRKGLPVRRFQADSPDEQPRVFCYRSEIDAWLQRQTTSMAEEPEEPEPCEIPETPPPAGKPRRLTRAAYFLVPFVLGLAAATWLWPRIRDWFRPPQPKILGVAPVRNLSGQGDPAPQQLAEALTEEMVTGLGRLQPQRFRVVELARTSSALPRHLDYLLEGSVRRAGTKVAITAQLVVAKDQSRVWGNSYELDLHDPQDMIPIEIEVRDAIIQQVVPLLAGGNRPVQQVNREAYEAYLWGRLFWNQRTTQSLFQAITYFKKAIESDPAYAPAYAGLADCYFLLGSVPYTALRPEEAFPQAEAAARKALTLDSTLAEAHISLGYSALVYRRDYPEAERQFKTAMLLRPEYPTAHHYYAYYLTAMGRLDEAIQQRQIARDLDPLSPLLNAALGEAYYQARQFDRSIQENQKSLVADPNYPDALMNIARDYEQKKMYEQSQAILQRMLAAVPHEPAVLSMVGHEYAVSGHAGQAREVLAQLRQMAADKYVPPLYFGLIYLGLGDKEKALQSLEKANEERSEYLVYLPTEPLADPLRRDRRFSALVKKIGLTPVKVPTPVRASR